MRITPLATLGAALFMAWSTVTQAGHENQKPHDPLLIGSVAMNIPAEMHARLTPLVNYLTGVIGQEVALRLSPNMGDAINEISQQRTDFAYLTPVAYVRAHARGEVVPVVKTITEGEETFRLMLVVAEDSPIQSIAELKGKRFAFGDRAAILQRAVVVDAGITLDDFEEYSFLGHYDNTVRGVMNGDFDAGILKDTTALAWHGKGVRILHESPALPPYVIVARKGLDRLLIETMQTALVNASQSDMDATAAIHALDRHYTGFAPASDSDYDVVRALIKPFE